MDWLSLILILLGFVYVFTHIKFNKKCKTSVLFQEHVFQYINGTLVTIIGVTLAIFAANYYSDKNDRNKTIILLEAAQKDLSEFKGQLVIKHSARQADVLQTDSSYYRIAYPFALQDILKNDVVIANINLQTFTRLNSFANDLKRIFDILLKNSDVNRESLYIDVLKINSSVISQYIDIEIDYLKGKTRQEQIDVKHSQILRERRDNLNKLPEQVWTF